jgi:RNA polymerase sigma-70 factor (ECF subfamily)
MPAYPGIAMTNDIQMRDNAFVNRPKTDSSAVLFAPASEIPLAELVARGRVGDAVALESLYRRYKSALFNLAYRYTSNRSTAEDLLQEIFLKIFAHLDDVQKIETFTGWVFRIALNTCYSHLREKRVEIEKTVPMAAVEGTRHEGRVNAEENDVRKPLDEAIAGLPSRLREIFLLHDAQGFKHEEIARMLGLSVGTSKSQLFKARLKIREILKARRAC